MESEAELDAEVKALAILAEHPELYEEFAKLGCLGSLVGLLAHENTDISIDAVEVIAELTDDEVESTPEQWNILVDSMVAPLFPSCYTGVLLTCSTHRSKLIS